jgi:hypothetical protein
MPNAAGSPFPSWSIKRDGMQSISEWSLMLHLFLEMLYSAGGKFSVCLSRFSSTRTRQTNLGPYIISIPKGGESCLCVHPILYSVRNREGFGWEQTSSALSSQTWGKKLWIWLLDLDLEGVKVGIKSICVDRWNLFLIHAAWRLSGCMLEFLLRWWLWEWVRASVVMGLCYESRLGYWKEASCATFLW